MASEDRPQRPFYTASRSRCLFFVALAPLYLFIAIQLAIRQFTAKPISPTSSISSPSTALASTELPPPVEPDPNIARILLSDQLRSHPLAFMASNPLRSVVINATGKHTATVLFLHGLGDTGHGWSPVATELSEKLPHAKFILPHAPSIPISINNGFSMPGWYDIKSLSRHDRGFEDEAGMMKTVDTINTLIKNEVDAGIPSKRIVLGGFSQGAAMSLLTSLVTAHKLGGIIGLSGYLPLNHDVDKLAKDVNQWTPYFMGHGDSDEVVEYQWGQMSAAKLKELGRDVVFKTYKNMGHSACQPEVQDVLAFLKKGFWTMHLFGKAKAKTTPKDAIVKIRESLEMLEKREKYLGTKIDAELKLAKANASKNKRAALMALKRKKAYEGQVEKIMGSRMTLEQQMMAIEGANINLETMNAMKAGASAMKAIHGELDINKVDATMDEIREQMDLANEVSEAIAQPVNFGVEFDEDELNEELELLEQQELDAQMLDTGLVGAPEVPTQAVPAVAQPPRPVKQVVDEEDAELAELKASMAF
ncbi:hypothetical protein HK101_006114 [Irineochytrium annulatum]|nr:hypothetical protein HK101_006114 [Irineochytrium annulatum]